MSVTLRKWKTPNGDHREAWQVFVKGTCPDGREVFHRKLLRGANRREALDEESRVRVAIRNGTYQTDAEAKAVAEAKKKAEPTVRDFWDETFMPYCRKVNSPSEIHNKEKAADYFLPLLGDRMLKDIGTRELDAIRITLVAEGLSPKTVKNYLMAFKRCLRYAWRFGLIPGVPYSDPVKVPAQPFRYLTADEVDRLVDGAEAEWKALILTAARTGLRIGELLALTWDDVDLKVGQVAVSKSVSRGVVSTTKTGQIRHVPLEPEVLAALREHRKKVVGPVNVFCKRDGTPLEDTDTRQPMRRACEKAGLKVLGWHVLRHTFASLLVIAGEPLNSVRELLGHTTMTMTLRYAHLSNAALVASVGKLTRHRVAPVATPEPKVVLPMRQVES